MEKRLTAVLISTMLLFSTLSFLSAGSSAATVRTYDFTDTANNKAFGGTDPTQPPTSLEIGTELSPTEYTQIASPNNVRALFEGDYSDYHRFKFKIFESLSTISQIDVEHDGYGQGHPEGLPPGPPGLRLFIWNYGTGSWEFLTDHNQGSSDGIAQATITGSFSKYIDANGYLNLLAQGKENAGSCPFLYTYDGGKYVFVADLYGGGIIDVPFYRPIPEDYAKIDSNLLQPDISSYKIQIAQEYDEISYLDRIALMTVDRSPDLEVYPSLLKADAGKIITVNKNLARPVSAIDRAGRDVLGQIAERDGIYTSGRQYELNILELNLGDLSGAEKVKLVISAYVNWLPGSASSKKPVPYDRFIQVKDKAGNWVKIFDTSEIIIPAAMPRTCVLDLSGKFLTNDYSVRIGFYPDVRFDFVGLDTSSQKEVLVNTLTPARANLHFRGYSRLKGFPAIPDYYDLSLTPPQVFSQPTGKFTRFGDVLPLLASKDDKYVILHHGDEISVGFNYLPTLSGMQRDFFLYSWGYYKNNYYGTGGTVEPLPFNGMSGYPYPASQSYPYDVEHMTYLAEYNTREYSRPFSYADTNEDHSIYTDYVKVTVMQIAPVGGILMPVNKLEILTPYLALVGLVIAVVSSVVIVRKKR